VSGALRCYGRGNDLGCARVHRSFKGHPLKSAGAWFLGEGVKGISKERNDVRGIDDGKGDVKDVLPVFAKGRALHSFLIFAFSTVSCRSITPHPTPSGVGVVLRPDNAWPQLLLPLSVDGPLLELRGALS